METAMGKLVCSWFAELSVQFIYWTVNLQHSSINENQYKRLSNLNKEMAATLGYFQAFSGD